MGVCKKKKNNKKPGQEAGRRRAHRLGVVFAPYLYGSPEIAEGEGGFAGQASPISRGCPSPGNKTLCQSMPGIFLPCCFTTTPFLDQKEKKAPGRFLLQTGRTRGTSVCCQGGFNVKGAQSLLHRQLRERKRERGSQGWWAGGAQARAPHPGGACEQETLKGQEGSWKARPGESNLLPF